MTRVNFQTNIGFFLVLLSIVIVAFIEGAALKDALTKSHVISGGEIQLISFMIISVFMILISTLKPDRLILFSYSAMTLGLILITTALFDESFLASQSIKTTEVIIGLIMILAGSYMVKGLKLSIQEQAVVKDELNYYKK